jgi:glc operon protein GlcG
MKTRTGILAFSLILGAPLTAAAQDLIVTSTAISSVAAERLVDACIAIGREKKIPIAVAVVDPHGGLLDFHALDGSTKTSNLTAVLKAETAAKWGRRTGELSDRVFKNENRAPEWLGDFPIYGGVPIMRDGKVLGGIGVGGGAINSEECALSAVKAVFGDSVKTER